MQSLTQFFEYLHDVDFPYVVLRNWENLPHSVELGEHSDLDLLVYDFDHFFEIFPQAKPQYPLPRVRTKMPIGDSYIYIDVRSLSDNYYPEHLSNSILQTREYNPAGFFTPNPLYHRLGLAYHAVHHKNCNRYKTWLGDTTVKELLEAFKKSDVGWVEPDDPTVGRYNKYWKGATSVVRKEGDKVVKKQTSWNKYNLLETEERVLSKVQGKHFPKVKLIDDELEIEDCGLPLIDRLPDDWEDQLVSIIKDLKLNKVIHRDIKLDNLMVKDGVVKLIDFGWATFEDDPKDSPPSCLGYPNKPSWGFDDWFSMRCVIRQIKAKKEQMCES